MSSNVTCLSFIAGKDRVNRTLLSTEKSRYLTSRFRSVTLHWDVEKNKISCPGTKDLCSSLNQPERPITGYVAQWITRLTTDQNVRILAGSEVLFWQKF